MENVQLAIVRGPLLGGAGRYLIDGITGETSGLVIADRAAGRSVARRRR